MSQKVIEVNLDAYSSKELKEIAKAVGITLRSSKQECITFLGHYLLNQHSKTRKALASSVGIKEDVTVHLWRGPHSRNLDEHSDFDVSGTLQFKNSSHLKKGLDAFEEEAYFDFYDRDSWTVDKKAATAVIHLELELPADFVQPEDAFVAIAAKAQQGEVEIRRGGHTLKIHAGGRLMEWLEE